MAPNNAANGLVFWSLHVCPKFRVSQLNLIREWDNLRMIWIVTFLHYPSYCASYLLPVSYDAQY